MLVILKRMYSQELVARAFQYFAASKSLHSRLRVDCQSFIVHKSNAKNNIESIKFKWNMFYVWRFQRSRRKLKRCVMAQHETCVKRCCLIIMELCLVEYLSTLF